VTRAVRPHHHHPESFDRLRTGVTKAFTAAGAPPELAEQSWYVLGTCLVSRLAGYEAPLGLGAAEPRFGLFLDALRARPAGTRTSRGPARARAAGVACPDPRTTMASAQEGA
jgi:hypothetical protein